MSKYECEYRHENVDKKNTTGAEKDCSICISGGQLVVQEFDVDATVRSHKESEATIDNESNAWFGVHNSQRVEAKWKRFHRSVALLS